MIGADMDDATTEVVSPEFRDAMDKLHKDMHLMIAGTAFLLNDTDHQKLMAFAALGFVAGISVGIYNRADGLKFDDSDPFDIAIEMLQTMKMHNQTELEKA